MEFLAESIGLLDMDGGRGVAAVNNSSNVTTKTAPSAKGSFRFFCSWKGVEEERSCYDPNNFAGEGSSGFDDAADIVNVDNAREKGDYLIDNDGASNNNIDHEHNNNSRGSEQSEQLVGKREMESEQEEREQELMGDSSLSLLSSLTPASPLTLSASSLNLLPTSTSAERKRERYNKRNDSFDITDDDDFHNEYDEKQKNAGPGARTTTLSATTTPPLAQPLRDSLPDPSPSDTPFTKHVTQRIDPRTNYDCFTGKVDAVTGHLVHGTMLYRQTGEVYEGPFISKYKDKSKDKLIVSINGVSVSGGAEKNANTNHAVPSSSSCDTIYLRHGRNATCQYSNGMTFSGSFEYDRPKFGKWICGDEWTYEGPLTPAPERENGENENVMTTRRGSQRGKNSISMSNNNNNTNKYAIFRASSSNVSIISSGSDNSITATASHNHSSLNKQLIGIPHPLPGSVLFHGDNGIFSRPSKDGFVYKGDFVQGLANGVGKEVLPRGQGVYCGEFENGLRHGVGTLVENYYEDKEKVEGGGDDELYCHCDENGGECLQDDNEDSSGLDHAENSNCAEDSGNTSSAESVDNDDDDDDDDQIIDHGPDFAAGGAKPTSSTTSTHNDTAGESALSSHRCNSATGDTTPIASTDCSNTDNTTEDQSHDTNSHLPSQQCATAQKTSMEHCIICHRQRYRHDHNQQQHATTIKKQRYSSGVWCAGQYEIEDCRGTVNPGSNEFTEEGHGHAPRAVATPTEKRTDSAGNENDSNTANNVEDDSNTNSSSMVMPLKRTTWDMLDEKWLGW